MPSLYFPQIAQVLEIPQTAYMGVNLIYAIEEDCSFLEDINSHLPLVKLS